MVSIRFSGAAICVLSEKFDESHNMSKSNHYSILEDITATWDENDT